MLISLLHVFVLLFCIRQIYVVAVWLHMAYTQIGGTILFALSPDIRSEHTSHTWPFNKSLCRFGLIGPIWWSLNYLLCTYNRKCLFNAVLCIILPLCGAGQVGRYYTYRCVPSRWRTMYTLCTTVFFRGNGGFSICLCELWFCARTTWTWGLF